MQTPGTIPSRFSQDSRHRQLMMAFKQTKGFTIYTVDHCRNQQYSNTGNVDIEHKLDNRSRHDNKAILTCSARLLDFRDYKT